MRSGTENKRQIYLLAALCVVIIAIAAFDSTAPSRANPIRTRRQVPRTRAAGGTNSWNGPGKCPL